ncbi:MAG TPA: hypothetical protein VFK41_02190 [Nocardioidaceae bacterium]|nr:hypothetical protein [Nocardioidaceae bacterium]
MGDKPFDEDPGPSLELPKVFGRKKKEPRAATAAKEVKPTKAARPPRAPKPGKEPQPVTTVDEDREFKLPPVPGRVAALVTGLLVGVLGTLLTWGSLEACEQVKGTDSCGGAGFFVLIVILLLMILAGGALLAAWDVSEPRSTSALGVGIVCILVLLLLMEELFDAWMFAVVPVICALAYYAAHWVTTALVDEPEPDEEQSAHDVR